METTTAQNTELSKIVNDFFEISDAEEHCERLTEMFTEFIGSNGFDLLEKIERSDYFYTYHQMLILINGLSKVHAVLEKSERAVTA